MLVFGLVSTGFDHILFLVLLGLFHMDDRVVRFADGRNTDVTTVAHNIPPSEISW